MSSGSSPQLDAPVRRERRRNKYTHFRIYIISVDGSWNLEVPSTSVHRSPASSANIRAKKRTKRSARSSESDSSDGSGTEDESGEHLRDDDDSSDSSRQTSRAKDTGKVSDNLHEGCYCNVCSSVINGFRYICIQCTDVDLCISCEAAGLHGDHYMLRVPGRRPEEEVTYILEKIREELFKHENIVESIKIEIEEEPDLLGAPKKVYVAAPILIDNQPVQVTSQITSSDTGTQITGFETPSDIPNKKSRMEMEQFLNFKDQNDPFYRTTQSGSIVPNTENVFKNSIPHIKVEVDVSEGARCEAFVHKDADSSCSELMTMAPDLCDLRRRQRPAIDQIQELGVSNFTAALETTNVTTTAARPVGRWLEPAKLASPISRRGATPNAQLSRPTVTSGRYFVEVTGTDTGSKEGKLPENQ